MLCGLTDWRQGVYDFRAYLCGRKSGPRPRRWAPEVLTLGLSFFLPGFGWLHLAGLSQVGVELSRVPNPSSPNLDPTRKLTSRNQPVQSPFGYADYSANILMAKKYRKALVAFHCLYLSSS